MAKLCIAVDPGVSGAFCIMVGSSPAVFDTPIIKTTKGTGKKKKKVTEYDLEAIRDLLKPFCNDDVLYVVEKVSARTGEGVTSSFNFGQGFGCLKMAGVCMGFQMELVTPATWKKAYPELSHSPEMDVIRDEVKAMRAQLKALARMADKIPVKKEMESKSRKLKAMTKTAARDLASSLFPAIKDSFKLKKHDGRAEACLIAKYAQEQLR